MFTSVNSFRFCSHVTRFTTNFSFCFSNLNNIFSSFSIVYISISTKSLHIVWICRCLLRVSKLVFTNCIMKLYYGLHAQTFLFFCQSALTFLREKKYCTWRDNIQLLLLNNFSHFINLHTILCSEPWIAHVAHTIPKMDNWNESLRPPHTQNMVIYKWN